MEDEFLEDMTTKKNETIESTNQFYRHFYQYQKDAQASFEPLNYERVVAFSLFKTFAQDIILSIILSIFSEVLAIVYTFQIREIISFIQGGTSYGQGIL